MEIRPIFSALRRHKTAAALIVLEIAVSCAIVCNALFLIAQRVDNLNLPSGIAEDQLLHIRLSGVGKDDNADARTEEDLAALRAIPGVVAVTTSNQLPFRNGSSNSGLSLSPEQVDNTLNAAAYRVGRDAIKTFGLKLVAGRDFNADEYLLGSELNKPDIDFSKVAASIIVSSATAKKLFPNAPAVGKTVYMSQTPLHIVGVVETLTRPTLNGGNRTYSMLLPIRDNYNSMGRYIIRVSDPSRRDEVMKAALATLDRIDSSRLVLNNETYQDVRADYFSADRDMIGLLGVVCAALLLVTALGIIGLASFWVAQRTRQIGVRRALGATRAQILRYFQVENFLLVGMGIALGMLLAYALNQLLMSRYELPRLPLAYLPAGAMVLWLLGQVAVLWPARRAAAVPPAIATRSA
ncbi:MULTISPECIES: ABC transporter permease [Pseudoxanthomonas]|jgi:putative ABC transport system permease protein|uniref:FtsX-like permease family protein n=1 Tax=Pseudoxanthomonas winnipegensis TaxID=2480810 RepID=A0A4Q8LH60_9GAMM|nr:MULTISPECIES: ABC transporter permease [Pseudoxanthomonas]PZP60790.1 MAG: ABC transporter permease [Pseudoxanthomonas spadix]TAA28801.1 FtsX-like permease family protein [Pseudoxanthomonas winnipegensis]TMN19037.1 FtsX-like permease family protein [Pseudoxanthomonas sp. X-1]UAY74212.1 ABC transporter permease [Pseudoxanthomonas sp. X-1]